LAAWRRERLVEGESSIDTTSDEATERRSDEG
jgi:hypothetical protein